MYSAILGDHDPFIMEGKAISNLSMLAAELKSMDSAVYKKHNNSIKNDFCSWILHCVGDVRLARDIQKIRVRKNLIEIIEKRIVQLKDFVRHPEKSHTTKRIDMYVDHVLFDIDNEICSNCEICTLVCPKEAVEIKDGKKTVNDDCTLCGFCVNFCPIEAMKHEYNGEDIKFFTENEMLPKLPERKDDEFCKSVQMFRGAYEVNGKCPKDCEDCVQACPINIIEKFEGDKQLPVIKVDKEKCMLCGACKNACPEKIIESNRVQVIHEGKNYCNSWNRALENLGRAELRNIYHNEKNMQKIRELIEKSELRKY